MFDKNSVYLPTKKIGKNNPKATEIEADNTARQEWNRTANLALVSSIEEAKILEIKQTEIHDKAGQSIRENGWLPNLFRGIVGKAKEFLQAIIREKDMPPKPVLNMVMDEFRTMQTLMLKVQKQAKAIKKIQEVTLPNLRQQLAETTGIFKGKDRKALEKQIQQTETELAEKLDVELWPDCPVTPFYSLLFKIMGLLNLLLFLYAILTLFSAKYDFIHLPVSLDTISLVALLTASALGIFGWKYLLCNLITTGAFLFLAFHVALSPVSLATDYTYTQLLSLIPAVVYMLHAGWLKLKKMKK